MSKANNKVLPGGKAFVAPSARDNTPQHKNPSREYSRLFLKKFLEGVRGNFFSKKFPRVNQLKYSLKIIRQGGFEAHALAGGGVSQLQLRRV